MKIKIVSVGRPGKSVYELCKDYITRAKKLYPIEHSWVKDGGGKDAEAKRLLAQVQGKLVLLTRKGKPTTSKKLALLVQDSLNTATDITFVIGGSDGFSTSLQTQTKHQISMSEMTLQHDLALLLFTEQIYRAYTILKNIPYHR